MLDQNTDRMWYVIGAVLVGAAIILIANGTLPQMFASVTGSFEEVSNSAIKGTSQLSEPRKNHLLDASYPRSTNTSYIDYNINMSTFNELKGREVTLSFEAKSETLDPQLIDTYFRVHDYSPELKDMVLELSGGFEIDDEYTRYEYTMVVPDFTSMVEYPLSIRIRRNAASGSNYVHINEALENGHIPYNTNDYYTIRHVKLELGEFATDYIPHEDDK